MATRVTLPPLDQPPLDQPPLDPGQSPGGAPTSGTPRLKVPVAKVQLLNDRGDRRSEAAWLAASARPGVVELLSTSEDPYTIVTAHAGARTMRTARLDPDAGLDLLTQVTDLLTELHREGFVHGKLTVDHVIIGLDGPVLCSPDGTAQATAVDLEGIARCMRELGRQWDEADSQSAWRQQWDDLARRLEDGSDPSQSAVRVSQALRRLAGPVTPSGPTSERARSRTGIAAAAFAVVLTLAGIAFVPTDPAITATGPRIAVEGSVYAVGSEGDDVALLDTPCDPNAPVVSLRPNTGEIWVFRSINDGAASEPVAVVPGATELRSEQRTRGKRTCHIAVARGPAGASEIDTASLLATADIDPSAD